MDFKELRYQIARAGLSVTEMAKLLGISRETYYKRMNGKLEWQLSETRKLAEILELNDEKIRQIFYS